MSRLKWEDQDIEELLRQMPKMQSNQSAETIYKRIQHPAKRKTQKASIWIPVAASIAAIFLLVILIPSYLNTQDTMNMSSSDHSAADNNAAEVTEESSQMIQDEPLENLPAEEDNTETFFDEQKDETISAAAEEQEEEQTESEDNQDTSTQAADKGTSLYASDLDGRAYMKTALVTTDAYVIPFTVILPIENAGQSMVDLYNEWAKQIDEAGLGFQEYHPLDDNFDANDQMITGTVDELDQYTMGASSSILMDVIRLTFYDSGYSELQLLNEDGSPAEINQVGNEPITLSNSSKGFYLYQNSNGGFYFVPSYDSYDTIGEALAAMKTTVPSDRFIKALPEDVGFDIETNGSELIVTMSDSFVEISEMGRQQMIEAILLTAESFSIETVKFENVPTDAVEGFNMDQPIEVPIGPNQTMIDQ